MCTQEIIWCACGHAEVLPIHPCSRAHLTKTCYTVIYGNHHIVLPNKCSYCKDGMQGIKPLGSARPREVELVGKVETAPGGKELGRLLECPSAWPEGPKIEQESGGGGVGELEDVLKTEFQGDFNLDEELGDLWRYCEGFEMEDVNGKVEGSLNGSEMQLG